DRGEGAAVLDGVLPLDFATLHLEVLAVLVRPEVARHVPQPADLAAPLAGLIVERKEIPADRVERQALLAAPVRRVEVEQRVDVEARHGRPRSPTSAETQPTQPGSKSCASRRLIRCNTARSVMTAMLPPPFIR